MKHFITLLNHVNKTRKISPRLEAHLIKKVSSYSICNGTTLLEIGQKAKSAWFLRSGFIVALEGNKSGQKTVTNIYCKGSIVTDLLSFFGDEKVCLDYLAVGQIEVLELKKSDYLEISHYPEISKLVQHTTFSELKMSRQKSSLRYARSNEMMEQFFIKYKPFGLPDKYCASFLEINLERYIELKVDLISLGKIKFPVPQNHSNAVLVQAVYEIKAYLIDNLSQKESQNIELIASKFNITSKTLNRSMKDVLGFTLSHFILKLKMEKAYILLAHHKLPVKEVYQQLGYKNPFHFSKVFKKYYGYKAKEALLK